MCDLGQVTCPLGTSVDLCVKGCGCPPCEDPNPPSWAQPSGVAAGGGLGSGVVHLVSCPPQESGLSTWIGGQLHPLENVPPVLAVLLITVVISFFTEFASNTATIIIFLPVLAELVRVLMGNWGVGRNTLPRTQVQQRLPRHPELHQGLQWSLLSPKMRESVRTMTFSKTLFYLSLRNA